MGRMGEWAHRDRQPREKWALRATEDVRIIMKRRAQRMNGDLFYSDCVMNAQHEQVVPSQASTKQEQNIHFI